MVETFVLCNFSGDSGPEKLGVTGLQSEEKAEKWKYTSDSSKETAQQGGEWTVSRKPCRGERG